MKLFYQTHSPYARKALVFAHEAGLADSLEVVAHETSPTLRNEEVFAQNPLGNAQKLISSYDWLERELDADSPIHVGHVALATALSWLEFRQLPAFRNSRPRLAAWFGGFESRASMRARPLAGETQDGRAD
jgi:glutathione S-transferase